MWSDQGGGRAGSQAGPRRPQGPGPAAASLRWADAPRRRRPRAAFAVLGVATAATLALAAWFVRGELAVSTELSGLDDGAVLSDPTAAATTVRLRAAPADRVDAARLLLDGTPVGDGARREGEELVWPVPPGLAEGAHLLTAVVPRWGPLGEVSHSVTFSIDRQPPAVEVSGPSAPVPIDEPVTITGRTEPGAVVRVGGQDAMAATTAAAGTGERDGATARDETAATGGPEPGAVSPDGRFELTLPHPPAGPARVLATDPAGNAATAEVALPVAYPPTRGVHVTGAAWSYGPLRRGILDLVEEGRINVVELDLKDESGIVNHDTSIGLAHEIGAVEPYFDLHEAVADLHARGVRVIGRVVAYRDPVLAEAAWARGWRDWVVQGPGGEPHGAYGGFTNPAHPDVRAYNLALALEAADAGVDDILWDYIRRPEGPLEDMVFPGMGGTIEAAVTQLLADGHAELRRRGAFQGASVFGVAASRPGDVAQDMALMAEHVDYVAPMVYPSHWRAGEYGVEDPDGQPYDIVAASVAHFVAVLAGSGATVVPWLQDFSLGHDYGPEEVRAQIEAAAAAGAGSFLLWDPAVTYTAAGLEPG